MLIVSAELKIPEAELRERFVRAPGPGGQNVNKVASAVELRFDARGSRALPDALRARLLQGSDRRINEAGVVVIQARRFRSQEQNREDARSRLVALIRAAALVPKKRLPSKPTRAARERRIEAKRQRAGVKATRGRLRPGAEG